MDTMGPNMSSSLLLWLVLVLPLLAVAAAGASVRSESGETGFTGGKYRTQGRNTARFGENVATLDILESVAASH